MTQKFLAILDEPYHTYLHNTTQYYLTKIWHSQIFVTYCYIILRCITSHRVSITGSI